MVPNMNGEPWANIQHKINKAIIYLFFWYFYGLIDQNSKHINVVGAVEAFVIGELRKNLKIGHEKFSIDADEGNERIY